MVMCASGSLAAFATCVLLFVTGFALAQQTAERCQRQAGECKVYFVLLVSNIVVVMLMLCVTIACCAQSFAATRRRKGPGSTE